MRNVSRNSLRLDWLDVVSNYSGEMDEAPLQSFRSNAVSCISILSRPVAENQLTGRNIARFKPQDPVSHASAIEGRQGRSLLRHTCSVV